MTDGFGPENLPYGAFRGPGAAAPSLGVRLGDDVIDLEALSRAGAFDELGLEDVLRASTLNPLLAQEPAAWRSLRRRLRELVDTRLGPEVVHRLDDVALTLPFEVGDYIDFYSSLQHASNLGRIFRPDAPSLPPAWRHLPIGYHGRSGSILVGGSVIRRPVGQRSDGGAAPTIGPSQSLDLELEIGFVTGGAATAPGTVIDVDAATARIFGVVLVNDWSARDLQRWEYVPLGPLLGKSFATSISAWVVPLDALQAARVPAPEQAPLPPANLFESDRWALDIELEVSLRPAGYDRYHTISRTNARELYWTFAQQLAHASSNGAVIRPGDLFASGTISGTSADAYGSLIELTWNGERPISLDGQRRAFLHDGDSIRLTGRSGDGRVSLGDVEGTIAAAPHADHRNGAS